LPNAKLWPLDTILVRLFQVISNFFRSDGTNGDTLKFSEEVKQQNWHFKQAELGVFCYNENGFEVELDTVLYSIKWTDIERLQAYKADLMTTDEICMDITFNNQWIMITEETPGWYQFIDRMKASLAVNENWEKEVLKSPFEYDLTTIYERSDRKMPGKSNFFSVIESKTKEEVSNVFQKAGWKIHKPSLKEYKLENSWTDIVLDNDSEGKDLLVHGLVAYHANNVKALETVYNELACPYKFEFYGELHEVLLEKKNGM
jgi:hypothetical protein